MYSSFLYLFEKKTLNSQYQEYLKLFLILPLKLLKY